MAGPFFRWGSLLGRATERKESSNTHLTKLAVFSQRSLNADWTIGVQVALLEGTCSVLIYDG